MTDLKLLAGWVKIYDNAITDEFCDKIINLYESPTNNKGKYDESWRRCGEYSKLDSTEYWTEFVNIIRTTSNRYKNEVGNGTLSAVNTIEASNIFRYDVDPEKPHFFRRHADNWNFPTTSRQLSIIVYLNDVAEGGETVFTDLGISVTPKKGRILVFPSFCLFMHGGEPPKSNSKYIVVTWLHFDGTGHAYRVHRM